MSLESRDGVRLKTRFETLYCSDRQEGEAVLADVSYSGALLLSAKKPAIGAKIVLYVRLPDDSKPVELRGKVVRHAPTGFAIHYDKPNPAVARFVDDEEAIASLLDEGLGEALLGDDDLDASLPLELVPIEETPMTEIPSAAEQPVVDVPLEDPPVANAPLGQPMLLSDLDLSAYSIPDLEALSRRIPGAIAKKRDEAKVRALQKVKKLAEQEGFSLEELLEKP